MSHRFYFRHSYWAIIIRSIENLFNVTLKTCISCGRKWFTTIGSLDLAYLQHRLSLLTWKIVVVLNNYYNNPLNMYMDGSSFFHWPTEFDRCDSHLSKYFRHGYSNSNKWLYNYQWLFFFCLDLFLARTQRLHWCCMLSHCGLCIKPIWTGSITQNYKWFRFDCVSLPFE